MFGQKITYDIPSQLPSTAHVMTPPKPRCDYLHHTRPESQGALITETKDFPGWYDTATEVCLPVYTDSLLGTEVEEKLTHLIGGGEGGWCYKLHKFDDYKLKKIARIALERNTNPKHVQFIYNFNVSEGWNIVLIVAIYDKDAS